MVPVDDAEFTRWRAQSDSAARMARLAVEGEEYAWACFLSEQAAQFALKALLHGVGLDAWGHDLFQLVERAREALPEWSVDLDATARLARLYIPTRYPDASASAPGSAYRGSDAAQAAADADSLCAAVDAAWAELG